MWKRYMGVFAVILFIASTIGGMIGGLATAESLYENDGFIFFIVGAIGWTLSLCWFSYNIYMRDRNVGKKEKRECDRISRVKEKKEMSLKIYESFGDGIEFEIPQGKMLLAPLVDKNSFEYQGPFELIYKCPGEKCKVGSLLEEGESGLYCPLCKKQYKDIYFANIRGRATVYFRNEIYRRLEKTQDKGK